jgi:hypothetical protein
VVGDVFVVVFIVVVYTIYIFDKKNEFCDFIVNWRTISWLVAAIIKSPCIAKCPIIALLCLRLVALIFVLSLPPILHRSRRRSEQNTTIMFDVRGACVRFQLNTFLLK